MVTRLLVTQGMGVFGDTWSKPLEKQLEATSTSSAGAGRSLWFGAMQASVVRSLDTECSSTCPVAPQLGTYGDPKRAETSIQSS